MTQQSGSYDLGRVSTADEAQRLGSQAASIWSREQAALRAAGLTPGLSILDIGCGAGGMLGQLHVHFQPKLAVGVDLNREFLISARSVAAVSRSDGARLPFNDNVFDFVLMRLVLRHAPSRRELINEAKRVVRPGGIVCAIDVDEGATAFDPEPETWPALKYALVVSAQRRGGDPFVGRILRRLLLEAGLVSPVSAVLPVTSADIPASAFVDVMLAPSARAIDTDLLTPRETEIAWAGLRQWAAREDGFGYVLGILAAARKSP